MRSKNVLLAFTLLASLSTGLKVLLAGLGHNFDLESWRLFAELVLDGKNVYAETYRNPYGPLWAYVCAGVSYVQHVFGSRSVEGFHRLVALLLSAVDVGIAWLLTRRYSLTAGALFLVNPVSLLISGFHSQFGNVAVLLALTSCALLDSGRPPSSSRTAVSMTLLGISLAFKHIFVFLPLWLFFRPQASRGGRMWTLVPLAIFGASFLPFVGDERGLEGVVDHVLLYDSFHLDGFFPRLVDCFVPVKSLEALFSWVPVFSGFKLLWLLAMMATGLLVRWRSTLEQGLVYVAAMVVFSSANADQYLAIPLAACAVYWRHFTIWWYVASSTLFLTISPANIGGLPAMQGYMEAVQRLGLDRSHAVAALFVFLMLYTLALRGRLGRSWLNPIPLARERAV